MFRPKSNITKEILKNVTYTIMSKIEEEARKRAASQGEKKDSTMIRDDENENTNQGESESPRPKLK